MNYYYYYHNNLSVYFNCFILDFITEQAINEPDIPDVVPHVPGTVRGKRYTAPSRPKPTLDDDIEISLDLGEDVEIALNSATTDEIVDLAGKQYLLTYITAYIHPVAAC